MARSKIKSRRPPKAAVKAAKDRRYERATTIKAVRSITAEQFIDRHKYCINIREIYKMMEDPEMGLIISENPKDHRAVCDHPEDGFCGNQLPSPEILKRINDRLGFRVSEPQEVPNDLVEKEEEEYAAPIEQIIQSKGITITLGGKNATTRS